MFMQQSQNPVSLGNSSGSPDPSRRYSKTELAWTLLDGSVTKVCDFFLRSGYLCVNNNGTRSPIRVWVTVRPHRGPLAECPCVGHSLPISTRLAFLPQTLSFCMIFRLACGIFFCFEANKERDKGSGNEGRGLRQPFLVPVWCLALNRCLLYVMLTTSLYCLDHYPHVSGKETGLVVKWFAQSHQLIRSGTKSNPEYLFQRLCSF